MLHPIGRNEITLSEVLDRVLAKGVVACGDATISVAGVDLIYVGLKTLLASVDTAEGLRHGSATASGSFDRSHPFEASSPTRRIPPSGLPHSAPNADPYSPPSMELPARQVVARDDRGETRERVAIEPERVERDLARLVLGVIELLRQLLERQAVRRVEGGSLSDDEIERLGQTLLKLESRMGELKAAFGLSDQELTLDLGPLRNLD